MSPRDRAVSLILLLLLAGCGEAVAPSTAPQPPPHFVRWAAPAASQLRAVVGRTGQGSALLSGATAPVAEGFGTTWAANASRLTWLHPVGFGANRLLVVGVSIKGDQDTVTAVTYGGASFTFLGARRSDDGQVRLELWYLTAPASGWLPIDVSLSGQTQVAAGAMAFSGVDQAMPLGSFVSTASTGSSTANPSVVVTNAAGGLVLAALATNQGLGVLTPSAAQQQKWIWSMGSGPATAGATAAGADTVTMGWTKTNDARWAIGAAVINGAPWTGPPLDQFRVSFWAIRGQPSSVQINYLPTGGGAPERFLRLDVTDPIFVPGRGTLALGDSVELTVTVDPVNILVELEPSGVRFGQPAGLSIWYGGAGGDLNGDGVVDSTDLAIEGGLLSVWCQGVAADPWTGIPAVQSTLDRTFTADLPHFSNYAVAYRR